MINKATRFCSRCVMNDRVDMEIRFDDQGLCHHCLRYDKTLSSRVIDGPEGRQRLEKIVDKIKRDGKRKKYDCVIGVSGGVDSTYVAYWVKKLGLRPLAIHFDNGWNSELAVSNIANVLKKLDIDLFTYVIDWNEFRDLQISFLRASTPDGEVPTDHAIMALLWREANRRGIKYIISGMNFKSESISVTNWAYGHADWRYIRNIHKNYGTVPLRTYPRYSLLFLGYVSMVKRIRTISLLNYIDFNKDEAQELLVSELGWRPYGGKHHESIYTRFYQGVFLPSKFGIDKRYGHLSDLINAGQLERSEAMVELDKPTYDITLQKEDRKYVLKKLGMTDLEFQAIENGEIRSFKDYKNSYYLIERLKRLANWLRSKGWYPL